MAGSGLPPPNSRDDFEIAIVCASTVEYDAVSLLIDQFWDEDGDKYGRATRDRNTYTTGRMKSFDIVLLLLPNAGKASAASAASSFRASFPNITLALLVGTCGGVPYTKENEEILLGDVVISKTVVQYDLGSQYTGQFQTKETLEERLGRPDPNIRGIVHIMETDHERERLKNRAAVLLERLQSHAMRKKLRKAAKYEYEYPGICKDRLFEAGYLHKHQVLLPYRCCEEAPCDNSHTLSCVDLGCEDDRLVQRQRLIDQAQSLSIFIGRFGSGDTILKSGTYRDQVAQRHGLLAFEMEGAGVWDELPCIIIKGISNYADGHRNADSDWQRFAAATAAATARALIERYPKTDRSHSSLVILERRGERTGERRERTEERRERIKEENECLRDMQVTDPSLDKKRIEDTNGGLLKDSYIWILSNAEFMRWRNNPGGGLLWIKGDPGKGKTMLMCGLINELKADGVTRPSYFFCQATNSQLNSATKVLCSLAYSIACEDELALAYVMEKYEHTGKELFSNTNSWTALSQILTHILRNISLKDKVFIVDGLDECVINLQLLLDFIAEAPGLSDAKWIVSSRNWSIIEERLNAKSQKLSLSLELNEQSISDAVRVYIKHKVHQLANIKKLDQTSRDIVQNHLLANANGTFLWVALVYKELFKGGVKKRHLQDLMAAFPPELGPLYARMIEQVYESRDRKICLQLLGLMSLTYRPISLLELTSFVQIPGNDDGTEELEDIVATCGSFLVLKNDVVYFVHQSAKEFLLNNTSDQIFDSGKARKHYDIFSRSIRILSQTLRRDIYKLRHPGAQPSVSNVPNPDPLAPLQYACLFWVDHLRGSSGETGSQASLQDDGLVHSFLKTFLLYWLEALCLMGKLTEGIIAIRTLESLTTQGLGMLHMFIIDARKFVLFFRSAIEHAPLQLYSSALLFTPTSSIVRQTFESNQAKWISQKPSIRFEWDACLQTLQDNRGYIRSLTFSLDNTKLASYSGRGIVNIWDRATGACLQSLKLTPGTFDKHTGMAFSPDSCQLAVAFDSSIKIFNSNSGACVMTLNNDPYMPQKAMVFSSNGRHLILSNQLWEEGGFRIWDLTTGMQLQEEEYYQDVRKPAVFIDALVYGKGIIQVDETTDEGETPDEDETPGEDEFIVVRSPITGSRVIVVSEEPPVKVVFTLDGMRFALMVKFPEWKSNESGSIFILDAATGKCLRRFTGYNRVTEYLALSPDGSQLATAYGDRDIHIWDVKTGASLFTFSGWIGVNLSPAFSPDSTELASVEFFDQIKIWDLTLGPSVDPKKKGGILSVTYSPDSSRLALITYCDDNLNDFTIEIWDPVEGIRQQWLQVDKSTASPALDDQETVQLAFSPDNTQLAYARGSEIAIQNLTAKPQQDKFKFRVSGSIQSIVFSPDGTRLATASIPLQDETKDANTPKIETPKIEIWNATDGAIVYTFPPGVEIIDVYFSSDSKRLGTMSYEGTAAIWDLDTGTRLQTFDFDLQTTFGMKNMEDWQTQRIGRAQLQGFIINMLQNSGSMPGALHEFDFTRYTKWLWLLRRGEPFLWLPPNYQSLEMTFAKGNIAIVLSDETLVLLSLSLAELDAEMASNRSSILKV